MELYRFYDADDRLLYVGISLNAAHRASEHRRDKSWWPAVERMTVERAANRAKALELERAAIISERPLHNVHHNSRPASVEPTPLATTEESSMPHSLIGKYVLADLPGQVVERISDDHFLVQWFSWRSARPEHQGVIGLASMATWKLWDDNKTFRTAVRSARDAAPALIDEVA